MRFRSAAITVALLAVGALCGCGGNSSASNSKGSDPITGDNGSYTCARGLEAIDLPLGENIEQDGSSFQLTQQKELYGNSQESVTLKVKLNASERLPAFIVTPSFHHLDSEEDPQVVVRALVGPGGTGTYNLLTNAYAGPEEAITSVRLCLNLAVSTSKSTPNGT